jgi:potassium-transporting ATPase potassium-binding subunit
VQNLKPYTTVDLIQPYTAQVTGADGKTTTQTVTQQVIAQGPVASQEMVKEFGTNGGGFFNAKVPIRLKIRLRFQTSLRWFSFSRLPPD